MNPMSYKLSQNDYSENLSREINRERRSFEARQSPQLQPVNAVQHHESGFAFHFASVRNLLRAIVSGPRSAPTSSSNSQ
jgi:hypothetical protein